MGLQYKIITGKIELLSGLHIGGSEEATQIGGMDSPVIRQPKDGFPYIPGSSIKGKMRSLLEMDLDKVGNNGNVHNYTNTCADEPCPICYIFGASAGEGAPIKPARLIVRDCSIDYDDYDNSIDYDNAVNKRIREQSKGLPFSEEKTEVVIDRIRGSAKRGGLRKTERVPAGTVFNLEMSFRVFDGDDPNLFETVKKGLKLLQNDCLGGSGSRGYGNIKFTHMQVDGEPFEV